MNEPVTSAGISLKIWLLTAMIMSVIATVYLSVAASSKEPLCMFPLLLVAALIGSIPALVCLFIFLPLIGRSSGSIRYKTSMLLLLLAIIDFGYGVLAGLAGLNIFIRAFANYPSVLTDVCGVWAFLFCCAFFAALIISKKIVTFFSHNDIFPATYAEAFQIFFQTNKKINMEHEPSFPVQKTSNRFLIKGLITGALILLMMIPSFFIQNLVTERQERQQEVVQEVSSRWAAAQTLAGPFLSVPYSEHFTGSDGKAVTNTTQLIITAEQLLMSGRITPEERPRSIYKVLLYRSALNFSGNFKPHWPGDIDPANVDFANAKLCFTLSDFKGIEEEISVNFNGQKLLMSPGLPLNDFGDTGLSVPVNAASLINGSLSFDMQVKLKGSAQLHFVPTGASSKYILSSAWPDPSFDGNVLPTERSVKDSGFVCKWNFNRANLSFGTVNRAGSLHLSSTAFGVSLVQPADQYNKTMRSVKYAILIIGLTFALFFIIEIMQRKPVHPVQYVLVGIALTIFYALLLSISEFVLFDLAYFMAAAATVTLITLYAKSHFNNWRTASVFGLSLSSLYGFVFILIRLEDTALLVGSIGLFIILALVMYASRKVNWYGSGGENERAYEITDNR